MAKRVSLREFQAHLATRLAGAGDRTAAGLLGVQAGSDYSSMQSNFTSVATSSS